MRARLRSWRLVRSLLAFFALLAAFDGAPRALADAPRPSPPRAALLPPIEGEWIQPVGDLGFVAPPVGTREPRPVIIAVHGMGDRPEWECSAWRAVFGPAPFIVCPRGSPWQVNFAWRSVDQIEQAIDAALDAAQARFGAHLDREHQAFVGFSQGAIRGATVVERRLGRYPYVLFQEGFDDALATAAGAKKLRDAGVRRVLLGCSQGGCAGKRAPLAAALARAGVEARVNDAGKRGHTIDEVVIRSLRREIPWLLDGDPAWRSVLAAQRGSEAE